MLVRQSQLFLPVRKEDPRDEEFANAKLLIRGGFIEKVQAGVYAFLPIGLRVLKRIETIIREEMDAIGGQELLLPVLHPRALWEKTGRWETFESLMKLRDASGHEMALGPTHEEVIVPLVKPAIVSYRDLPFAVYQIQTKFRMERRPKSGLLRGREFPMKDLYSFHVDEDDLAAYYERVMGAYRNIFFRLGLGDSTVVTYASGGTFSQFSHEFQTMADAGEDTIYLCSRCRVAVNDEIIATQGRCPQCGGPKSTLERRRAIEVGNIFQLKTRFSDPFRLTYRDASGAERPVFMGCYGIGLGRAMAAVVEAHRDARGIRWPESVAPFAAHVLAIGSVADGEAARVANALQEKGIPVLYDDRGGVSAGEKLATADLLGIPWRIIVSEKTLANGKAEVKRRTDDRASLVSPDNLPRFIARGTQ